MKSTTLTRAVCHQTGVVAYDQRGRRRGFNYETRSAEHCSAARSKSNHVKPHRHSESESQRPAAEVIRAYGDDGRVGLAVLPADFTL